MPDGGDAVKLTVYVGRRRRVNGAAAFYAVCELLHQHRFAGATVFLGVDGTAHGQRRRARFFSANTDVPIMIVAVGPPPPLAPAAGGRRGDAGQRVRGSDDGVRGEAGGG